ncbi:dehypoxanthine futalosine cyclase [Dissulfurirhabdus thermomarina]|uniref:Cyclic dehypoxanthine futalosine synthase n=1 Tax=Dissulfurirhabdus thermomarina TaxID=1765737 RepID=A0A6N9TPK2_DISTH|nr:cyclic dehypoxanthinyl futalosine synthase [Dissulfurirhabdus thermomarina]NDY43195.1 dehypoxanthine futalosine cyclase [Dissulfurirhabdus thermomarina]NMX23356.1 dehypoxanthine futalosine cyclase [Dissulfurirhabdus thermomarina]
MDTLVEKVRAGKRLSGEEALVLLEEADLLLLGQLADEVRRQRHPEPVVTYVIDRNINYTNVCVSGCRFCAYFRPPGHPEAYVLSREELGRKVEETLKLGGTQVLLQGGLNPDLPLEFYEEMLDYINGWFGVHCHAFSPPEIVYFADRSGLTVEEVLRRLVAAGLKSIPGGGAEILVDRVRREISPRKATADQWLAVMETAHGLGLRTTATMMFGHVETPAERIEHLLRLRDLQDRTGGFTAFICWPFQPGNTALKDLPPATGHDYLRTLAVSRLVLDNFANIQASWVTQGPKVAQIALFFGANDFGSTMIEENVVAAAGVSHRLAEDEIRRLIREAGFTPRQRTMDYRPVGR